MYRLVIIFLLLGLLCSACTPASQHLGIPASQWENFPKSKRRQLMLAYKKASKRWDHLVERPINKNGHYLKITMEKGLVMMPPFDRVYPYDKKQFFIYADTCRSINLKAHLEQKKQIDMRICYLKDQLLLDISHFDDLDTDKVARLNRHPLWKKGLVYPNVSSRGYVRLQDVQISLISYDKS